MNELRTKVACMAFDTLDANKDGVIDFGEVKSKYDGSSHPAVIAGRKTEKQVLDDFISSFELYAVCYGVGEKDGRITRKEFIEYYNNISASIDNDEYFCTMMKNGWKLPAEQVDSLLASVKPTAAVAAAAPEQKASAAEEQKAPVTAASAPKFNKNAESALAAEPVRAEAPEEEKSKAPESVVDRFRQSAVCRGVRGVLGIERQFKVYAKNDMLELDDFKKAVEDFRLHITGKVKQQSECME